MPDPAHPDNAALHIALAELAALRAQLSQPTYDLIAQTLHERLAALDGAAASASDPDNPDSTNDEIRLVTVMFVDVVNSTRLALRLGHEWKFMIGDVHRRLVRVVEAWDGQVGQYLGDGLLCFFGARHSRSDDPIRAVGCGLAIQQMAAEAGRHITARYKVACTLRVGIATGRVVVGMIGTADKRELLATGSTTNLAARLQEQCPLDGVVIDAATYQAVRNRFQITPQPPVALRGFDEPLPIYQVTGRRHGPSHVAQIAGIALPFLGRRAELQRIEQVAVAALIGAQCQVVTITGEMGLGKSRLLDEALGPLDDDAYVIWRLTARYERRGIPYQLLSDLIDIVCHLTETTPPVEAGERLREQCATMLPPAEAGLVAAVLGQLAGLPTGLTPPDNPDTVGAVTRWLLALAGSRVPLLVVDNLQWVDAHSLRLLEGVTHALNTDEALIIGTTRPDFHDRHPAYLANHPHHTRITLDRLPDAVTGQLIDTVLHAIDNPPPRLRAHILERAAGNPLFVEQFLQMLFDNGVFEPAGADRWRTNVYIYGTLASTLPNGLMGVFQARLDDLPQTARRVVQVAAVVGQIFWEGAVSFLSGFDTRPLLDELVQRGLLLPDADSGAAPPARLRRYRFRHTLIGEVAYSMLTRPDREKLHALAAQWIAAHLGGQPEYFAPLADHLFQAGRHEQALAVYLSALEDRGWRGLHQDVLKLVERGLASARGVPRTVALPLVSQMWAWQGAALNGLGRHAEASASGHTALMLLGEVPPDQLSDVRQRARDICAEAERHLHSEPPTPGRL